MSVPPLVARAGGEAVEAGPLLHLLAAQRGRLRVGEIGTGRGEAAAWLVSALAPGVPFVGVEADADAAAAARALFRDDPDVRVLTGDWRALLPPEAPFDLLACHGPAATDDLAGLLAPGGTVVAPGPLEHPLLVAVQLPWATVAVRSL